MTAFSLKAIFARDFDIALSFAPVILPILAMPWGYVFRTYGWPQRAAAEQQH